MSLPQHDRTLLHILFDASDKLETLKLRKETYKILVIQK